MMMMMMIPASILYKSIAGRYRPVSYPDGPITARYRFIKNAYLDDDDDDDDDDLVFYIPFTFI